MNRVVWGGNCVVGIASSYGFEGSGSNAGGGEIFTPVKTDSGAHPDYCKMSTGFFFRGIKWLGRQVCHLPPTLCPSVLPIGDFRVCPRVKFTLSFNFTVFSVKWEFTSCKYAYDLSVIQY